MSSLFFCPSLGFHKYQRGCCWNNLNFLLRSCVHIKSAAFTRPKSLSPIEHSAQPMTLVSYFGGLAEPPAPALQNVCSAKSTPCKRKMQKKNVKEMLRSPSESPTFLFASSSVGLLSTQTPRGWRAPPASSKRTWRWIIWGSFTCICIPAKSVFWGRTRTWRFARAFLCVWKFCFWGVSGCWVGRFQLSLQVWNSLWSERATGGTVL